MKVIYQLRIPKINFNWNFHCDTNLSCSHCPATLPFPDNSVIILDGTEHLRTESQSENAGDRLGLIQVKCKTSSHLKSSETARMVQGTSGDSLVMVTFGTWVRRFACTYYSGYQINKHLQKFSEAVNLKKYLKEQHVTFHWLLLTVGQSMIEDPRAACMQLKTWNLPTTLFCILNYFCTNIVIQFITTPHFLTRPLLFVYE